MGLLFSEATALESGSGGLAGLPDSLSRAWSTEPLPHQLVMSCVSILIRDTVLTQKDSGEGSDSVVGTGHNLAFQGGAGLWRAGHLQVTVQDGVPPQRGGWADPMEQVWVRAGDGLGPAQASVCKSGRQLLGSSGLPRRASKGNQHSLGTFWAPGLMPDL